MVRTICPSLPMRMKAFGVNAAPAAPSAEWAAPVLKPIRSPPPSAALALRNCRRERSIVMSCPFLGRVLDSLADSHISAAATDVPRHGSVDIAIGRLGVGREQRRRGHDLAGLAIAALRHLEVDGARAAQAEAATEFRTGHSEHIAKHPEHRRVVVDFGAASFAVDCQRMRHLSLLIMGLPSVGLAQGNASMSPSAASLP